MRVAWQVAREGGFLDDSSLFQAARHKGLAYLLPFKGLTGQLPVISLFTEETVYSNYNKDLNPNTELTFLTAFNNACQCLMPALVP
jgi:hypothetical protein